MYKRKKATTLIEIIIYLGLLSSIIGLFGISISYFKEKDIEMKINDELLEIKYAIIETKMNCKNLSSIGYISFSKSHILIKSGKYNRRIYLENLIIQRETDIIINQNGRIDEKKELSFKDKNSKYHVVNIN